MTVRHTPILSTFTILLRIAATWPFAVVPVKTESVAVIIVIGYQNRRKTSGTLFFLTIN